MRPRKVSREIDPTRLNIWERVLLYASHSPGENVSARFLWPPRGESEPLHGFQDSREKTARAILIPMNSRLTLGSRDRDRVGVRIK